LNVAEKLENTTQERFSYEDYLKWETGNERWELVDGEAYAMASPNTTHQTISGNFYFALRSKLGKDSGCKVFSAPMDVLLERSDILQFTQKSTKQKSKKQSKDTVVQPDILVVCDPKKIGEKAIEGVPDLIIEILSPSNAHYDTVVKFAKYREVKVQEIWFVDPDTKTISVYTYDNETQEYKVAFFNESSEKIPVGINEGIILTPDEIFA